MNNDRFRFRCWDKEASAMGMVNIRFDLFGTLLSFTPADFKTEILWDDERYVLMACTGLKDSEGKLIFEGDILDLGLAKRIVQWWAGAFYASEFLDMSYGASGLLRDRVINNVFKVIGSIYENPELMEGK